MLSSKYKKLSLEDLYNRINEGVVETVILAFTDHYGRMLGKRIDADYFYDIVARDGTHACDYVFTTDMEMEPVPGYEYANWELGYGDFHLVPDLSTLRIADWLEKTAILIGNIVDDNKHESVSIAPRSILQKVVAEAKQKGFGANAATELEYYLYENSYREAFEMGYSNLKSSGYYLEDYHILQGTRCEKYTGAVRKHLKRSGIVVENSKGEWGLGQHEINIRYSDILSAADNHVYFKQCAKEVAEKLGMAVTFMAKPYSGQAGSSSHIHLSLTIEDKNAFKGEHTVGPVENSSDLFRWFLGGWIKRVSELMPFYAPTINSYKRFVDGSWAPTRLAWSFDNRTAGFRVVGSNESLRIECRIPGADCNPYLALAASLASGLDGIENRIEPPTCFDGDIYAATELPRVPYTLEEALPLFENSIFVRKVFGEDVQKHYAHFYKTEIKAYNQSVTDWERKRYFEQI